MKNNKPQYDWVDDFALGLAVVKIGKNYGYIDQNTKIVIKAIYDRAENFVHGLARVRIDKKWCYIDNTGKIIGKSD